MNLIDRIRYTFLPERIRRAAGQLANCKDWREAREVREAFALTDSEYVTADAWACMIASLRR